MRFMILLKANAGTEADLPPSQALFEAMSKYNEELTDAGVLLSGEGLQPSAKGARVQIAGDRRTVVNGPFSDPHCLIAGFWIFEVQSLQEAVDWVMRCPLPFEDTDQAEIEIRPLFEMEDFGEALTSELRAAEERMRARIRERHGWTGH